MQQFSGPHGAASDVQLGKGWLQSRELHGLAFLFSADKGAGEDKAPKVGNAIAKRISQCFWPGAAICQAKLIGERRDMSQQCG